VADCIILQKYLTSDRATFGLAALKSRHNKVWFGQNVNHLAEWRILPFDPLFRMELEYTPVPVRFANISDVMLDLGDYSAL
jgi:hypothetical protein